VRERGSANSGLNWGSDRWPPIVAPDAMNEALRNPHQLRKE